MALRPPRSAGASARAAGYGQDPGGDYEHSPVENDGWPGDDFVREEENDELRDAFEEQQLAAGLEFDEDDVGPPRPSSRRLSSTLFPNAHKEGGARRGAGKGRASLGNGNDSSHGARYARPKSGASRIAPSRREAFGGKKGKKGNGYGKSGHKGKGGAHRGGHGGPGSVSSKPMVIGPLLRTFGDTWSVDEPTLKFMAQKSDVLQRLVIDSFTAEDEEDVCLQVRNFTLELEASLPGREIWLGNLPADSTEQSVRDLLEPHGAIIFCELQANFRHAIANMGLPTRVAKVVMETAEEANFVIEALPEYKVRLATGEAKPGELPVNERMPAKVLRWYPDKGQGYGFISLPNKTCKEEIFMHQDVLCKGLKPMVGLDIIVELAWQDERGAYRVDRAYDQSGVVKVEPMDVTPTKQLQAFSKSWDLDEATVSWIARVHPEVQEYVIEIFPTEADTWLISADNKQVEDNNIPSQNLILTGVPLMDSTGDFLRQFTQLGTVEQFALKPYTSGASPESGRSATIRLSSVSEAILCKEDLEGSTVGDGPGLCISYSSEETKGMDLADDLPENEMLKGKAVDWSEGSKCGTLKMGKTGQRVLIPASAFVGLEKLVEGLEYDFMMERDERGLLQCVQCTVGFEVSDPRQLDIEPRTKARAVRDFVRETQILLEKADCENLVTKVSFDLSRVLNKRSRGLYGVDASAVLDPLTETVDGEATAKAKPEKSPQPVAKKSRGTYGQGAPARGSYGQGLATPAMTPAAKTAAAPRARGAYGQTPLDPARRPNPRSTYGRSPQELPQTGAAVSGCSKSTIPPFDAAASADVRVDVADAWENAQRTTVKGVWL